MEEASPTFGWWFAAGAGCERWPCQAHETRSPTLDRPRACCADRSSSAPRTTPRRRTSGPQSLAEQLGDATLLTYEGEGHTAYGRSNQCIIDAVDGYFVDGTVPDSGTIC